MSGQVRHRRPLPTRSERFGHARWRSRRRASPSFRRQHPQPPVAEVVAQSPPPLGPTSAMSPRRTSSRGRRSPHPRLVRSPSHCLELERPTDDAAALRSCRASSLVPRFASATERHAARVGRRPASEKRCLRDVQGKPSDSVYRASDSEAASGLTKPPRAPRPRPVKPASPIRTAGHHRRPRDQAIADLIPSSPRAR